VLTAGNDGAKIYDLETKELAKVLKADMGNVYSAVFLTDGRRALTGSQDGCVRLWNTILGKELQCFQGHAGPVYGVAVSRDGKRCVSIGQDKTLRVWNLADAGKSK
jgi:WD40 repeat protein